MTYARPVLIWSALMWGPPMLALATGDLSWLWLWVSIAGAFMLEAFEG